MPPQLTAAVRASAPPPAGPSKPPPAAADLPGTQAAGEPSLAALAAAASGEPSATSEAAVTSPAPAPSERPSGIPRRAEDPEIEATTNPQIKLAELAPSGLSDRPKAVEEPLAEPDERPRPRVEIPREVALAAGRVTSLDTPPVSDEVDVDTDPRIQIVEEPAPQEPVPSVVVTRTRMISDPPAAMRSPEPFVVQVRRTSQQPPPVAEHDEIETFVDIDDGDDSPGKLEIPSGLLPGAAAAVRAAEPGVRPSKVPPPPPPPDASSKSLPKKPALPAPPAPQTSAASSAAAKPQTQSAGPTTSVAARPPPPPAAPKKSAPKAQPKRRHWWEDFFSDDYLHSVRRPESAQIAKQVDFLEQSLGLNKGDAVLDVGCGLGLHSLELARRGYLVVGLDLSLPMITRAAEDAQQEGLRINFMHADVREIAFSSMFDAVICVGTTFGFFDDDTNRDVLMRLSQALKPGGRLLLDVVNRDYVIRSQPNLVWFEGDGCVVMEESDFNYFTSRLTVELTMMRDDGRQSEAEYSIRLYSLHELGQMMQQAAFWVKEVSGQEATRGVFFGSHSMRMMLLGERRAAKSQNGQGSRGEGEPSTGELPRPPSA
jgi:2-polyprenyl-3-methyl-5-hydroxy-6-metoxy-1,4-benzoquinol methylase